MQVSPEFQTFYGLECTILPEAFREMENRVMIYTPEQLGRVSGWKRARSLSSIDSKGRMRVYAILSEKIESAIDKRLRWR